MERNFVWSTIRLNIGTFAFQNFYAIIYFFEDYEISNYADDTTPYSAQRSHQFVIEELEKSSAILFEWRENDFMKVNTDKSHLLLSGNTKLTSNIDNNITESE